MGRTGRCKWCHRGLQDLLHDQFNLCAIPEASILPCHLQPLKSKWVLLTEVLIFIQYSFIYSCFNIFATKQRTDNQTCIESVWKCNLNEYYAENFSFHCSVYLDVLIRHSLALYSVISGIEFFFMENHCFQQFFFQQLDIVIN